MYSGSYKPSEMLWEDDEAEMKICAPSSVHTPPNKTWSPLSEDGIQRFHDDLIVIMTRPNCTPEECKHLRDIDPILRSDESITCVTSIKPAEHIRDHVYFEKSPSKTAWQIPSGETETEDLDVMKPIWQHCALQDDSEQLLLHIDNRDAFIIHRHCWELLQAICKREHPTPNLTPARFWRGAMKYAELFIIPPHCKRRELLNDFPWYESGMKMQFYEDDWRTQPETWNWAVPIKNSFSKSVETGVVNVEYRKILCGLMDAFQYVPIDEFPLHELCLPSLPIDPNASHTPRPNGPFQIIKNKIKHAIKPLQRSSREKKPNSASSIRLIDMIPVEIVQEIGLHAGLGAAKNLGLTCKSMSKIILPFYDQIALEEIMIKYPWMLAVTPRENRRWQELVLARGDDRIPWFQYMRKCLQGDTYSMTNRRRAWWNAQAVFKDLEARDLL